MTFSKSLLSLLLFAILVNSSCTERENLVVPVTAPEGESRISQAALEQFIFRVYIDLIGAAPSEAELAARSAELQANDISFDARKALIEELQTSSNFREAYSINLYLAAKARFLESFPDAEIQQRFIGLGSADDDSRLTNLLNWPADYLAGQADLLELQRLSVFNLVYDEINMGSFNLVRATFDNLLWRYPTDTEFNAGFAMVENSQQQTLFGFSGSNKEEYIDIIASSEGALQGIVIWQYDQLLARRPTAAETLSHLDALRATGNVLELQQAVMQTDEYAGF